MPAVAAGLFESAFRRALPSQVVAQPELLFQLVTLLSPRVLQRFGVPVSQTVQRQGEFLITFPGVYYGGFNHGVQPLLCRNIVPASDIPFHSGGYYASWRS